MKIANCYMTGGLQVQVALEADDQFDREYSALYQSRENGAKMRVDYLSASVDMEDGEVHVKAHGNLYNANGALGERRRDDYLEPSEIPLAVREIIAEEARLVRERIASVKGVEFR